MKKRSGRGQRVSGTEERGGTKRGNQRTRIDEVLHRKAFFAYVSMRQRDDVLHSMTHELFPDDGHMVRVRVE